MDKDYTLHDLLPPHLIEIVSKMYEWQIYQDLKNFEAAMQNPHIRRSIMPEHLTATGVELKVIQGGVK